MIEKLNGVKFDFDYIKDSIVHDAKVFASSSQAKRIASIALPFLCFYAPVRTGLAVSFGAAKSFQILNNIYTNYQQDDLKTSAGRTLELAKVVTCVYLSVYQPVIGIVASSFEQIVIDLNKTYTHIEKKEWQQACGTLYAVSVQILYLASVVVGGPQLKMLSLLSQATLELYCSYKKLHRGQKPEAFANLLLALIRLSQAPAYGRAIHRAYFGKEVTQEVLQEVMVDIQKEVMKDPKKVMDLDRVLEKRGYSNKLKNVSFSKAIQDVKLRMENETLEEVWGLSEKTPPAEIEQIPQTQSEQVQDVFSSFITALQTFVKSMQTMNDQLVKLKELIILFLKLDIDWKKFFLKGLGPKLLEEGFLFRNMELEDCDFSNLGASYIRFKKVSVKNCNFFNFQCGPALFNKVVAQNCNFSRINLFHADVKNTRFINCNFTDTSLAEAMMTKVSFINSNLTRTALNASWLSDVLFDGCKLLETCFLDAIVHRSSIHHSDLTDCLFVGNENNFSKMGNTPHVFTRPVIGFLWDFQGVGIFTDAAECALRLNNAIILKFDSWMMGISNQKINKEVIQSLGNLTINGTPSDVMSLPDALLQQATPESSIGMMRERAHLISRYIDGLFFPGLGDDIKPEFYGQMTGSGAWPETHYRRSICAFSMIEGAQKQNLPIHGVCHGAQLTNVYFGGTLRQCVKNHAGVFHELNLKGTNEKADAVVASIIEGPIMGLSMHHQANDKIGKGLHVVLEASGVPKVIVSEDGRIVLTQTHPELGHVNGIDRLRQHPNFPKAHEHGMKFFKAFVGKADEIRKELRYVNWDFLYSLGG